MSLNFVGHENFFDSFQMDQRLIRRVHGVWQGIFSMLVTVTVSIKGCNRNPDTKRRSIKAERELMSKVWQTRIKGVVCGHRSGGTISHNASKSVVHWLCQGLAH